jgi:hypothetical protein
MKSVDDQLREYARYADEALPWVNPTDVTQAVKTREATSWAPALRSGDPVYGDALALPTRKRSNAIAALVAAAVVLVLLGGVGWLAQSGRGAPSVSEPAVVTTVEVTPTTEAAATTDTVAVTETDLPTEADTPPIIPPLGEVGVWHEVGRDEMVDDLFEGSLGAFLSAQHAVIDGRHFMVSWIQDGLWVSNDGTSWERGPEVPLAGSVSMSVSRSGLFFGDDRNVVFLDTVLAADDPVPLTWEVPSVDLSSASSSFAFEVFSGQMAMIDSIPILLMYVSADIDLGLLLGLPGTRTEEVYDGEEITRVFELVADDDAVQGRFRWEVDESGFNFFNDATDSHVAHLPIAEGGNWDEGPYGDGIERVFASGQERTVVVRLDTGAVILDKPGGFQFVLEVPGGLIVANGSDDSIETLFTNDGETWEQITIPGEPWYVPALGIYESSTQGSLWTSPDGLEWTRQPDAEASNGVQQAHRPIRLESGWLRTVGRSFELTAFEYSRDGEIWTRLELPAGTVDRTWGWGYTIGDRVILRQALIDEDGSGALTVWAVDIDFSK